MKKEMEQFLNETLEYFGADPVTRRCTDGRGGCAYNPDRYDQRGKSEGCAIGRKMTPEQQEAARYLGCYVTSLADDLIPESLKGMNMMFLRDVQELHDSSDNWNLAIGQGLTKEGEELVARIRAKYLDNGEE